MTFSNFSPSLARLSLMRRMRRMGYGRIHDLPITDCEPIVSGARMVQRYKLTRQSAEEIASDQLDPCDAEVRMFAIFDRIQNGIIPLIEVQHGIPCHIEISQQP